MTKKVLVIFVLLMLLGLTTTVFAQTTGPTPQPSDDEVNAIAKQMYCPVCENTPLDVCPTTACQEWRELIRLRISQGWTDQQIKEYFVEQYGDRVLSEPPRRGLNWLVYVLPPVFIVLGGGILARVLRSMRKTAPSEPPTAEATANEDPYIRRLEEELRKQERDS